MLLLRGVFLVSGGIHMAEQSADEGQGQGGGTLKMRYYTPDDVALHNCAEDCWLSLFGQVITVHTEILVCVLL